jgi:hypothetical protein
MLKPEIFSYFFLALYLEAVVRQEIDTKIDKISWPVPLLLTMMMILWANLHSGFVIGLGLLLILSLRDLFMAGYSRLLKKSDNYSFLSVWTISFFSCLLGSLVTPYGIALWQYIPCLYFHPVNRYIGELQPITIELVLHNLPLLLAFGSLLILALLRAINIFRSSLTPSNLTYLFIAVIGAILGLLFQRLITFGLLLMLPLIGSGFRVSSVQATRVRYLLLNSVIILFAIGGGIATVIHHKPSIPVVSKAFKPPFKALKFIEQNKPQGNLLNDPEFGDVLLWNCEKPPKVFADTRFDIYPWQILQDYIAMSECHSDWEKLCTKYKIDWVFLPPSASLCHNLEKNSLWQQIFKDEYAKIFVRKK